MIQILDVEEFAKYTSDYKGNPSLENLEKEVAALHKEIETKNTDNTRLTEATSIF